MGFQNKNSFIVAVCLLSAATLLVLVGPNKTVKKDSEPGPLEDEEILVGKHSEAEADDIKTATQ